MGTDDRAVALHALAAAYEEFAYLIDQRGDDRLDRERWARLMEIMRDAEKTVGAQTRQHEPKA